MKNDFINRFRSKIKLNIKGKNIDRFIRKLIKNKIEIINLEKIKYNEINIIVFKNDLDSIYNIKTIYDIDIKRKYGLIRLKDLLIKNRFILFFLIIGISSIVILSNIIFSVEVIHSDSSIRKLIKKELKNYGISKYHLKKNYHEKEKIKESILNKYKDKIEWIEIEEKGTKYLIKLEERIINNNKNNNSKRHVVAGKSGIIIDIDATSGEIVKNINDYVSKGDIIISGNLYLNEELKEQISAEGKVYAEVWYKVNISYPYHYKKDIVTGNSKNVLTFKIFNNYYDLFNFNKYNNKKIKNKVIIKDNLLPISFIKQKQVEINKIDKKYNKKNVLDVAIEYASKNLLSKLKNDSKILNYKILNKEYKERKVNLEIFFSVKEDITDYQEILENDTKDSN